MTTAADLVNLVSEELHGWGISQDRVTGLTNSILSTDFSFTVDAAFGPATGIQPGVVEIDSELLYVSNVDPTSLICTVAPGFGRGYLGTVAAGHTAGAKIVSRPKFPRSQIFAEINNVLGSVFPELFKVTTATLTVTYPVNSYVLPGSAAGVLDVQWQDYVGNWHTVRAYELDMYDHSLKLAGGTPLGRPLRVTYMQEPAQFTTEGDNYTITGLPTSCLDVLTKGAASRMMIGVDVSRAQSSSVEQSARSRVVPPHAGMDAANYLRAEFAERLKSEAIGLRKLYPPRIVRRF